MANVLLQKNAQPFGNSASARTLVYTSNVTAGSLLTCWVPTFNPGITVTVSDNMNGSWTQVATYVANGNQRGSWWYFKNSASGAITVTMTPSSSAFTSMHIHEHSVTSSTGVSVDNTSTGTGSSTAPATGTCTVSGSGELVLAGCGQGANANIPTAVSPHPPFTLQNTVDGTASDGGGTADDVNASASEGATFTLPGSALWCAMAVSFNTSGVVTPPWYPATPPPPLHSDPTTYAAI